MSEFGYAGQPEKLSRERDPVCGRMVEVSSETPRTKYKGKIYCFCSDACQLKFRTDADGYAAHAAQTEERPSA